MKLLFRKLRASEGAEIAEAAVVLPVVFIFLLGIVWFGRAFNIYSTITQAAQKGAITAARPTCATCGAPSCNWSNSNFPCDTTVANTVLADMQASSLDSTKIQLNPNLPTTGVCSNSSNITICREVLLNPPSSSSQPAPCGTPASSPPVCGVVVTFRYKFDNFYLPFTSLNLAQVTMTAQAQSRMEN